MAKKKQSGLGDAIATVTEAIGVKPCNGCKERQSWLNVNFAFNKPKPLTEEQKARIETEPLQVYNEAFNMNIEEEMFKDGVKKAILKKLNKLKDYEK
jgi:hypothetical protein